MSEGYSKRRLFEALSAYEIALREGQAAWDLYVSAAVNRDVEACAKLEKVRDEKQNARLRALAKLDAAILGKKES